MLVTLSGIFIDVKRLQFKNATASMLVVPSGMEKLVTPRETSALVKIRPVMVSFLY